MKRRAMALFLAVLMMTQSISAGATELSEVQEEKIQKEQELKDTREDISSLKEKKKNANRELKELDEDLVVLLASVDILNDNLDENEKKLEEVRKEYKEAKKTEKKQYTRMKKRIKFLYENGDNLSVMTLFEEENSFAGVLNGLEYVSKIYQFDRQMLTEYRKTKEQVAVLEEETQEKQAELEQTQEELNTEQEALELMITEKSREVEDFDNQLKEAKKSAEEYRKEIEELNERYLEAAREQEEAQRAQNQTVQEQILQAQETIRASVEQQNQRNTQQEQTAPETTETAPQTEQVVDAQTGEQTQEIIDDTSESLTVDGTQTEPSQEVTADNESLNKGSEIAGFACQFIGNPYVWGGTDLYNGCDCSGFTQQVMAHFGISIPRTSYEQRSCGREVSYSEAQPGDLICYSGHVAMYIGGGMIVHAAGSKYGIITSSATYRSDILTVRRLV